MKYVVPLAIFVAALFLGFFIGYLAGDSDGKLANFSENSHERLQNYKLHLPERIDLVSEMHTFKHDTLTAVRDGNTIYLSFVK